MLMTEGMTRWKTGEDNCTINFMRERREFPTHVGAFRRDFAVNVRGATCCIPVRKNLVLFPRTKLTRGSPALTHPKGMYAVLVPGTGEERQANYVRAAI